VQEKSLGWIGGVRGPTLLLCLVAAILTLCAGAPGWATAPVSDATNPDAIFFARGFEEPLVPTSATSPEENKALSRALKSYQEAAGDDPFRPLEEFLVDHPQSGWRVALLTNLGLSYYHRGFFSKTIEVLEKAWTEGQPATDPRAKALVDRAVGELLWMHARLGHSERLAALLEDIGDRPLTGPATELLTGAKEGLSTMWNEPGVAYLCGPMALKNLLLAQGTSSEVLGFLDRYRSSPQGVTLAELGRLADVAKLPHRLMYREPGEPVPVPSVVHWKVNHFAAIVEERDGQFQIQDPTFGEDLWITRTAIDSEASGYFLILGDERRATSRIVGADEASEVRGMGFTITNKPYATTPDDDKSKPCPSGKGGFSGMCGYNFTEMVVSLNLTDRPVGYAPPKGPPVYTQLTYNQREFKQPANFSFFNVSPKWTLNWLSYIVDDPQRSNAPNPYVPVERYVAGGGNKIYSYNTTTQTFVRETRDGSLLVRTSSGVYQRRFSDGSTEIYDLSDGATTYPRRLFLSQIVDPAGNAVILNYDQALRSIGLIRLISVLDATGRLTTFSYDLPGSPLLITRITDPFGRSATLTYDNGRLSTITDVLGLNSHFTYDPAGLVNSMTTPYGTTTFDFGDINPLLNKCQPNPGRPSECNGRFVQATDPLGHIERLEFRQQAPGIPNKDPDNTVPQGIVAPLNQDLEFRNTFYWDRHVHAIAAGDYTKARIKHWTHDRPPLASSQTGDTVESIKYPLESRIWFNYPGQPGPGAGGSTGLGGASQSGTLDKPSAVGRVLDDGNTQPTQLTQLQYNALGNVTSVIDPVGRETIFDYAPNQIDLQNIRQKSSSPNPPIAQFTYNTQHLPEHYTDAAGQTTSYIYNSAGQLTKVKDALGNITSYEYDPTGYLLRIINANGATQASFTYDNFGRVHTRTDSEGHTVTYSYDAMDRVTEELYPDGTSRNYTWDKLDLQQVKDRQGHATSYTYDAVRNLKTVTDALGSTTRLEYYENQKLKSLTDPNGNTATWDIDIEGRATAKHYADGSVINYQFENTTSRLKSVTDATLQVKQYTYALDDRIIGVDYQNAANPTPSVQFKYDPIFPLITSMTDGAGTTYYQYYPVGSLGALQLAQEDGPFANDVISYRYDALRRVFERKVGGNTETFGYDAIGRLVSDINDLGAFSMSFLGQTRQITALHNGTVDTTWTYETNHNDRRLQSITNTGVARGYLYTTTPENLITTMTETGGNVTGSGNWTYGYDAVDRLHTAQSSATIQYTYAYDPASNLTTIQNPGSTNTLTPNGLNQIGSLNGTTFSYDPNGNLTQDDQRSYRWDAENRLIGIGYNAQPSKQTTMRYDGLGRRIAIITTDGGMTNETRHLWCGETLCQARNANDVVIQRYFAEGEETTSAGALVYYARDHLGSVRDLLMAQNGSGVASYDYDPYGSAMQTSGQISSNFRYAGMFYHEGSGLYLTRYRAYDPRTARWLSRDPLGELSGSNLYAYVRNNPVSRRDPRGLKIKVEGAAGQAALQELKNSEYGFEIEMLDELEDVFIHIQPIVYNILDPKPDLKNVTSVKVGRTCPHSSCDDDKSVTTQLSRFLIDRIKCLDVWKHFDWRHMSRYRVDYDIWYDPELAREVSFPLDVLILHELLGHVRSSTVPGSEADAIAIENDYRDARGLPRRSPSAD
jgi:RHS repeat-associated protein